MLKIKKFHPFHFLLSSKNRKKQTKERGREKRERERKKRERERAVDFVW